MGEVIRKSAAVDDILADVRKSFAAAQAAGGPFKTLADQTLKQALALFDLIDGKLRTAQAKLEPLQATQLAKNASADRFVGRLADDIWNDVGRPAQDPQYELLFPSGISFYTEGPDDEQPTRMELLAEMIESGLHPRLDATRAKAYAKQLRDEATAFEAAVEAARKPRAQVTMFERLRTASGRNAHSALVSYKRLLRAQGISEAKIHEVIPDRPSAAPVARPPAPHPEPVAPTP